MSGETNRLLALAKQVVEMHGGSIEAHSAGADQGAEFVVRLPVAEAGRYARYRLEPEIPADRDDVEDDLSEDEAIEPEEAGDDA